MKLFISVISILILPYSFQKDPPDKIIFIIDQLPHERSIGNTIETFWQDEKYFDTVQFTGKTLVTEFNQLLDNLTKSSDFSELSYESCIIRYRKNKPIDTFYSWRWSDLWYKGTTMYIDKSKKLEGLLKNLVKTY